MLRNFIMLSLSLLIVLSLTLLGLVAPLWLRLTNAYSYQYALQQAEVYSALPKLTSGLIIESSSSNLLAGFAGDLRLELDEAFQAQIDTELQLILSDLLSEQLLRELIEPNLERTTSYIQGSGSLVWHFPVTKIADVLRTQLPTIGTRIDASLAKLPKCTLAEEAELFQQLQTATQHTLITITCIPRSINIDASALGFNIDSDRLNPILENITGQQAEQVDMLPIFDKLGEGQVGRAIRAIPTVYQVVSVAMLVVAAIALLLLLSCMLLQRDRGEQVKYVAKIMVAVGALMSFTTIVILVAVPHLTAALALSLQGMWPEVAVEMPMSFVLALLLPATQISMIAGILLLAAGLAIFIIRRRRMM